MNKLLKLIGWRDERNKIDLLEIAIDVIIISTIVLLVYLTN